MGSYGIIIMGNETRNSVDSDLNSVHIVRLLLQIQKNVDTFTQTFMFELNEPDTWGAWVAQVEKYLESIKSENGLAYYKAKMDRETISASDISNRIMNGQVDLQFIQDGEIINLTFGIISSGDVIA
jgi:phage tail sheath protein FI